MQLPVCRKRGMSFWIRRAVKRPLPYVIQSIDITFTDVNLGGSDKRSGCG